MYDVQHFLLSPPLISLISNDCRTLLIRHDKLNFYQTALGLSASFTAADAGLKFARYIALGHVKTIAKSFFTVHNRQVINKKKRAQKLVMMHLL